MTASPAMAAESGSPQEGEAPIADEPALTVTEQTEPEQLDSPGETAAAEEQVDPEEPVDETPAQTKLTLSAKTSQVLGSKQRVTATLTGPTGGVSGKTLQWTVNGTARRTTVTNASGQAVFDVTAPKRPGTIEVTSKFGGDQDFTSSDATSTITVTKTRASLSLSAPKAIEDGKRLRVRVTAKDGTRRLAKTAVRLVVEEPGRKKTRTLKAKTNAKGVAVFRTFVFRNARLHAKVGATSTRSGATTKKQQVKFRPAGSKVSLPGPAPRVKVPKQPMAITRGANVRISKIPNGVWKSMQGKSWRPGCMPRSSLRYVRVNYWSHDGFRRQGELIIAASASKKYRKALNNLYARKIPIRSMYRVDRFGYSSRVRGADDYKSMAADNTSAFNCRGVVGRPGTRSPHASGKAFDINPWLNPFSASHGWTPNSWWVRRSHHSKAAWNSSNSPAVKAMRAAGFRWTYGNADGHQATYPTTMPVTDPTSAIRSE